MKESLRIETTEYAGKCVSGKSCAFRCSGMCSSCGRCMNAALARGTDERKTRMLIYPEDFAADKNGEGLGAAFDVGTTTVVGMLWDMKTGEQLAAAAKTNPQIEFGRDVISRITACGREGENLQQLRDRITGCMRGLLEELCAKADQPVSEIHKVTVCGNTTMSHIFAGYSPMSLALAPFTPAYEGPLKLTANEADLNIEACVTVLPNIAGHVGGDITAGIIATEILAEPGLVVMIDIGTNGEIVLRDGEKNRNFACSTAAGPAFEGNPKMRGSELIDAVARMLDAGAIDKTGKLVKAENASVTQKDIREVQLAKGAILAGIRLLLNKAERTAGEIDKIIIAGAFGNYIDKKSALRIGLLPEVPEDRIVTTGNAAGAGVSMTLVSAKAMQLATEIPQMVEHVELADEPDFQTVFLGAMGF